jgi:DNA-binding helix-hairpin-helix protein with protein kinase domain
VGFVMPLVVARGPIDEFIHPVEREGREKLVSFRDLVGVGLKLTLAARSIHDAGLVIGDVNESNVLVREDGSCCFLDTDSFQVTAEGEVYTCPVAKELFLPPELHGKSFATTRRDANHDGFGIAVLLFQLLMNGRHPFVGIPKDGSECHIHERIKLRDFAYRRDGTSRMSPPPGVASITMLGELASLFDQAFLSDQRPTMAEWAVALRKFGNELAPCASRNRRHFHLSHLPKCPLCALPRDPYPSDAGPDADEIGRLDREVRTLERELTEVRSSLLSIDLPDLTDAERKLTMFGDMSLPDAKGQVAKHKRVLQIGVAVAAVGVIFAPLLEEPLCLLSVATLPITLYRHARSRRRTRPAEVALRGFSRWNELVKRVEHALREARRELDAIPSPLGELSSISQLESIRRQKYMMLDRSMESLERTWAEAWKLEALKLIRIDDAAIEDIGGERKRILRSHGIVFASDIEEAVIRAIPGFGPHLTLRLVSWKTHRMREIASKQPPGIPREWRMQHDARRRAAYCQVLRNDRTTLQAMRQRALDYRDAVSGIRIRVDQVLCDARSVRQQLAQGRLA